VVKAQDWTTQEQSNLPSTHQPSPNLRPFPYTIINEYPSESATNDANLHLACPISQNFLQAEVETGTEIVFRASQSVNPVNNININNNGTTT